MRQAFLLNKLDARFRDAGYARINFTIITNSSLNADLLKVIVANLSVTVVDESAVTPFNDFDVKGAYIFDNCARLVYIIYDPWSSVQRPYLKAAVLSSYFDAPCGECSEAVSSFHLFITMR